VTAARWFTGLFAMLLMAIAVFFAKLNVEHPDITVLPLVLGVTGYILGPMLGIFLLGMFTKTRGSDRGNMIALTIGLFSILVASGRHVDLLNAFAPKGTVYKMPDWMPKIEFTWYVMVGAWVTLIVGLFFRTPPTVLRRAVERTERSNGLPKRPRRYLSAASVDVPHSVQFLL
jgi:Na+/proline symporter